MIAVNCLSLNYQDFFVIPRKDTLEPGEPAGLVDSAPSASSSFNQSIFLGEPQVREFDNRFGVDLGNFSWDPSSSPDEDAILVFVSG